MLYDTSINWGSSRVHAEPLKSGPQRLAFQKGAIFFRRVLSTVLRTDNKILLEKGTVERILLT